MMYQKTLAEKPLSTKNDETKLAKARTNSEAIINSVVVGLGGGLEVPSVPEPR